LNPNEAQMKNVPGSGDAIVGRDALTAAGITPGVHKPFEVLVEGGNPAAVAAKLRQVPGVVAAVAPKDWRKGDAAIVEAFPAVDGASSGIQPIIDRVNSDLKGTGGTLSGVAAVDRDFVHAIYGNFPYLLAFVLLLTFVLLARAFRSLVLPLKAVILNLLSLAAALGIVVFIFQMGHGSSLWGIDATQAVTAWIPLMIFAFLFGLSMDYEVFMLSRMREAYDETARGGDHLRRDGDPGPARAGDHAPARIGELVDAGVDEVRPLHPGSRHAAGGRDRAQRLAV